MQPLTVAHRRPVCQTFFEPDNDHVRVCATAADGLSCYRSEAAMDAAAAQRSVSGSVAAAATCNSALHHYDGTSFGGAVLT